MHSGAKNWNRFVFSDLPTALETVQTIPYSQSIATRKDIGERPQMQSGTGSAFSLDRNGHKHLGQHRFTIWEEKCSMPGLSALWWQ